MTDFLTCSHIFMLYTIKTLNKEFHSLKKMKNKKAIHLVTVRAASFQAMLLVWLPEMDLA